MDNFQIKNKSGSDNVYEDRCPPEDTPVSHWVQGGYNTETRAGPGPPGDNLGRKPVVSSFSDTLVKHPVRTGVGVVGVGDRPRTSVPSVTFIRSLIPNRHTGTYVTLPDPLCRATDVHLWRNGPFVQEVH